MNVIYASDDNYAWLMGISMVSLFENNRESHEINVWLFGDGISPENEERLHQVSARYGRRLEIIDVNRLRLPEKLYSGRYPKSAFSRLFAFELLPTNVDRVIYLDCDIIVDAGIEELYNHPMEDRTIWAVKDCVSKVYKQKIGIAGDGIYINTGVMLMDIEKMRRFPIGESITAFVEKYSDVMDYADQEIINGIFQGEFGILPPEYNVMTQFNQYSYSQLRWIRHPHGYYSRQAIEYAKRHARIFHYTTCMLNVRPWYSDSRLSNAHVFNRYLRLSPWYGSDKKAMNFSGGKHKVMRVMALLPKPLTYFCMGMLHAYFKPYYTILKLWIRKKTINKKEQTEMAIE